VSGTLAYALSAGKRSSPLPLAWIELLDDERGVLVPFDDPQAIADKTIALLDNDRASCPCANAHNLYARDMVWDPWRNNNMGSLNAMYNERLRNPRLPFSPKHRKSSRPAARH